MKTEIQQLKNEFVIRTNSNPRYSLRAFARDLEVSPSLLCEVMKGKRSFSQKVNEKIANKLGWSLSRHTVHKSSDEIKALSWLHLSILELSETEKLKNDPAEIAYFFGCPEKAVAFAIETLISKDLLSVQRGFLVPTPNRLFFGSDVASHEIRRFHKEFMQLGQLRMEMTDYDERELSSSILSLSKTQVQELRKRVRATVAEFCKLSRQDPTENEVYGFSVQLFKITNKTRKRRQS